jgi:N-acyl-D-aspartate/D-glutamate deacylase
MENEPATEDDLRAMEDVVREAMSVGALGLTGSRTPMFRSPAGKDAPGYGLALEEMIRLGRAAGEAGHGGVIGINTFFENLDDEFMWLRRMHAASGLSVWFLFTQQHFQPEKYPILVKKIEQSVREGEPIFGQHAGRPVNHLLGLMSSRNPFLNRPSYQAIKDLSLPERVARLKDPVFRERLLSEKTESQSREGARANAFHLMFRLGDPPDYEPPPEKSIAAIAKAAGRAPEEVALDMMLERDGHELILSPVTNYLTGDASVVWDMLHNPNAFVGLGDGGAHSMTICDESIPTFMLTHWARDRKRGPKLSLEQAVRKVTSQGAEFFGLKDRGVLAVGKKADINVIDFDGLTLHAPEVAADQPAGGSRLVQGADGYVATIVAGTPIFENGKATGEMPGRLIRSTARSG